MYIGRVGYVDYDIPKPVELSDEEDRLRSQAPRDHPLKLRGQFFKKRMEFQQEREIRVVLAQSLTGLFSGAMTTQLSTRHGGSASMYRWT